MKKNKKLLVGVLGANLLAASALAPSALAQTEIVQVTQEITCPTPVLSLDLDANGDLANNSLDPNSFTFPTPTGIPQVNATSGPDIGIAYAPITPIYRITSNSAENCEMGVELRMVMTQGFIDPTQTEGGSSPDPVTDGWLRSRATVTYGPTYNYANIYFFHNTSDIANANLWDGDDPLIATEQLLYADADPANSNVSGGPATKIGELQRPSNSATGPTLGDTVVLSAPTHGFSGYVENYYSYRIALPGLTNEGTYSGTIEWQLSSV